MFCGLLVLGFANVWNVSILFKYAVVQCPKILCKEQHVTAQLHMTTDSKQHIHVVGQDERPVLIYEMIIIYM